MNGMKKGVVAHKSSVKVFGKVMMVNLFMLGLWVAIVLIIV